MDFSAGFVSVFFCVVFFSVFVFEADVLFLRVVVVFFGAALLSVAFGAAASTVSGAGLPTTAVVASAALFTFVARDVYKRQLQIYH